jgi:hypothetical protein
MPDAVWPNLFVVGAPKAGTTSLWRYLGQHPDIFMSPEKEPRFFSSSRKLESDQATEAYLELFAAAGHEKLRGEASPTYMSRTTTAKEIHRVAPGARIVISLREPVERTHSSYMSLVNDGVEQRSFREAVEDDLADRRRPGAPVYVKRRLYAPGVRRYQKLFGAQVFVLFFEELTKRPAKVMEELYGFLGVDPGFAEQLDPKAHNQFKVPRNRAVQRAMPARQLVRAMLPSAARERVNRAVMKPAAKPRPEPEVVERLCRTYRRDVDRVRGLIERPFPRAWDKRFPPSTVSGAQPGS